MLSNTKHRINLYLIIIILQYMAFDVAFVNNVFSCKILLLAVIYACYLFKYYFINYCYYQSLCNKTIFRR